MVVDSVNVRDRVLDGLVDENASAGDIVKASIPAAMTAIANAIGFEKEPFILTMVS